MIIIKSILFNKISFLFFIFISILIISVGYASYNTQLLISGEAVVTPKDIIKVSNIELNTAVDGAYETLSSTFSDDTTDLFISLPSQNSSITFNVEITNETNNRYHLDINDLFNSNENISYEITDGDSLFFEPNSVNSVEIRFFYEEIINSNIDLVIELDYDFFKVNFTNLEYLTSTGVQYIDTGVMNTGDYIFESEFLLVNRARGEGLWLFSGRKVTQYTVGIYFYMNFATYNYVINTYGGNTAPYTTIHFPKNTWYNMYFSRTSLNINSIDIPVTTKLLVPPSEGANILLGANIVNWDGSVDTRYFEGDIKFFKITDALTKNVIRNFIPVKLDDTGEVGYFDLIGNQFYENVGSGDFLEP